MTRIEAPGRLHFGLLHVPTESEPASPNGLPARRFGGVGLMLDSPRIAVEVEPSETWRAHGPSSQRALKFAQDFTATLAGNRQRPFAIRVETCPDEHIGLGVGTALGLATAKAIAVESGHEDWSATELALRIGRGLRSAVGIHGFDRGGLIVEAGKLPTDTIAPLVGRYEFPAEWRIVLIRPEIDSKWHGANEQQAFRSSRANPTAELSRLVLTGLLPALSSKDFVTFGESLHEYNLRAGEAFSHLQGGPYAHPKIGAIVAELRALGIRGVGQSSWGPTVFAVARNEEHAQECLGRIADRTDSICSTTASARGFGLAQKQQENRR